jgi:hypothetical protein
MRMSSAADNLLSMTDRSDHAIRLEHTPPEKSRSIETEG